MRSLHYSSVCSGKINDSIIEILLIADALDRAGAERINGVLRIFPYARQERREKNKKNRHKRRPISARLIADLLSLRFYGIIAFDLHAEAIEGFFSKVKVENIIPFKIFSDYLFLNGSLKRKYKRGDKKPVLVAADNGSMKKVSDYAENLDLDYAIVNKKRINSRDVRVKNVIGNVRGKKCVLIDDISATAGTLIAAKDALIKAGATEVIAMVTHFEGKNEKVIKKIADAGFKEFIITDSIPFPKEVHDYPVFKVLPLPPMVAKVINNIYNSESLQPVVFEKE